MEHLLQSLQADANVSRQHGAVGPNDTNMTHVGPEERNVGGIGADAFATCIS